MAYEIIKRVPDTKVVGVNMGNGHQGKFKNGIIRTNDKALADDIRQTIGQDGMKDSKVLVAEVPDRGKKIRSTGWGPGKWAEIREEKERENK